MVDPARKLCVGWTSDREMPFEQVVLQRCGVILVGRVFHQLPDIGVNPLDGGVLDIHWHFTVNDPDVGGWQRCRATAYRGY